MLLRLGLGLVLGRGIRRLLGVLAVRGGAGVAATGLGVGRGVGHSISRRMGGRRCWLCEGRRAILTWCLVDTGDEGGIEE